ncbi:MAG: putative metal-binding motif-containing protein [Deltaproteobacteria bacterium]|nr:putative metal-binding motif-containing protein [Deltaproteobacteria bacterium]MBN2671213.1 putative metal-binding motif-containing protein [Deltaproteobacteria bacterium]
MRFNWMIVFFVMSSVGCSLVLDTDVLQHGDNDEGSVDSDTTPVIECQRDGECDDGFACTSDQCGANNQCVHLADNSLCGEFEYCAVASGCTPTGAVCNSNDDCDDGVSCTIDSCELGNCRNSIDHALCSNSVPFCREAARCIPEAGGCVEGDVILCDAPADGICLAATCNEQTGGCDEHLSAGADNDTDGSLDVQCGGDDCDDNNADVFPQAPEFCSGDDNDCDGVADASFVLNDAVTVVEASSLSRVRVAQSGALYGVLYTSDVTHAALVNAEGTVVDFDLTTLTAGTPAVGDIISDPQVDGGFLVVWNSLANGNVQSLSVARLVFNDSFDAVNGTMLATLDSQVNPQSTVVDCDILYDSDRTDAGWTVAWTEMDADDGYVFFQAHDMSNALSIVDGLDVAGTVSTVSFAAVGAADYLVNFAADYTATSGGDNEIYEARVQYDTAFAVTAPATLISRMDDDGVDDSEPSLLPSVAADSDGNWYTAYLDYSGFGSLRTIALWDGTAQIRQEALATPVTHDIRSFTMTHDGEKLALVYLVENTTITSIVLKQLVPTGAGGYDEAAGGALISIAAGGTGTYLETHAAPAGDGAMTVGWIYQDTDISRLQVSTVGTCIAQ